MLRSKECAFIQFTNAEDATRAVENPRGNVLGRVLRVGFGKVKYKSKNKDFIKSLSDVINLTDQIILFPLTELYMDF